LVGLYILCKVGLAFLKHLANFTTWARNLLAALQSLWARLFGWMERDSVAGGAAVQEEPMQAPLRPFSSYGNPFTTGVAEKSPPVALVRYSFEALQAWAREAHIGREPGETPLEFVERLGGEVPALEDESRSLGNLYVHAAYAGHRLNSESLALLRQFWQQLHAVAERPMSAGAAGK
jgi:hypothetical protein